MPRYNTLFKENFSVVEKFSYFNGVSTRPKICSINQKPNRHPTLMKSEEALLPRYNTLFKENFSVVEKFSYFNGVSTRPKICSINQKPNRHPTLMKSEEALLPRYNRKKHLQN